MRLRLLACGFAMGVASTLATTQVVSQDERDPNELETADAIRLWQKYGTPTRHHKRLEAFVGDWDVTTRAWWEGPQGKVRENRARLHTEMIFDGRFLKSELEGTIKIDIEEGTIEMPVRGLGITGYDSFKKKYVQVWLDSNNTQMFVSEGHADEQGRIFRYFGTMDEWMTGEHDKPVMYVDRVEGRDTILSEIHDLSLPPSQTKVFEMEARRAGTAGGASSGKPPKPVDPMASSGRKP